MKSCQIEVGKEYRIVGVHKDDAYYDEASLIVGDIVKIKGNVKQYTEDTFGPDVLVMGAIGGYFVKGEIHEFYAVYFAEVE